ncbi:MAG: lysylphosphatidylglycerol synthase transmembrane domain-containing protein [Candidatus Hydrothermarchaeales archaeon]
MRARNLLPLVIAIILVAILLTQIRLNDILYAIKNISLHWLIFGFVLYIIGYYFRALRFHILLGRKISIKELFWIVSFHNMTNNLLPARTGEFPYIYLVRNRKGISTAEGVATLAIARILDFVAIAIIFIISTFFVFTELPPSLARFPILLIIAMLFVIFVLYSISSHGEDTIKVIEDIASKIGVRRSALFSSLLEKGKELQKEFQTIKSRKIILNAFLASILIWGFIYLMVYVLINDVGITMGLWGAMFCNTFAILTTILPVQGIGGFGTREGGWTIGFILLGVSLETAIATSFALHIAIIVYFFIPGIISLYKID